MKIAYLLTIIINANYIIMECTTGKLKMNMKMLKMALAGLTFAVSGSANSTLITNGSFETGNFTGWDTQDLSIPFHPLQVSPEDFPIGFGFFGTLPTDGSFAAIHGFDGNGPGTIKISQDIFITDLSTIEFDYHASWDLISFGGPTSLERIFDINIEDIVGGTNLANFNILTVTPSIGDTGFLSARINLSDFIGQTVRLSFDWYVPENFTGPAFFQLDNVRSSTTNVHEPSTLVIFTLGFMGLILRKVRRNKCTQNI